MILYLGCPLLSIFVMNPAFMSSPRWKLSVLGLMCPAHFSMASFSSDHDTSSFTAINTAMKLLRGLANNSHFLLACVIKFSMVIDEHQVMYVGCPKYKVNCN